MEQSAYQSEILGAWTLHTLLQILLLTGETAAKSKNQSLIPYNKTKHLEIKILLISDLKALHMARKLISQ